MSSTLFRSNSVDAWRAALDGYADAVSSSDNPAFIALDKWVIGTLPTLLRKQGHITQPQLSRLMKYKLLRGKWRPRLQMFVDGLDKNMVVEVSSQAFQKLTDDGDRAGALKLLSGKEMKGVGPVRSPRHLQICSTAPPSFSLL